jgi:suppressor of G2 allele of SKP1
MNALICVNIVAVQLSAGPPKYPSSAAKAKDWDRVVGDITKQEGDEKPEGDAALNALFQNIYSQGSDEVKRAMNKSFVSAGFHCVKN